MSHTERLAFEQWLGIKPCGAAHDLAWSAWQARASLPAPQQATTEPVGEPAAWRWFNSNGDQVTNWLDFKAAQKANVEAQVAEACGRIEYAYTHPAPGVPEGLDEDQLHTVELAADLLEHYAAYINEVKPDDIERHPYLPEIELTAADLRALSKRGGDA